MERAKSLLEKLTHRTALSSEVHAEESRVYCSPLEFYQPLDEFRAADEANMEETVRKLRNLMRESELPMYDEVLRGFGYPSRVKLVPRVAREGGREETIPTIMVVVDAKDARPDEKPIEALKSAFETTRLFLTDKKMTNCALEFVMRGAVPKTIDTEMTHRWINEGSYVPQQVRGS
jgi:hypothetical protein